MALQSYPLFLQPRQYSAQQLRHFIEELIPREGVVNSGDMLVTQRAAGANMSVDIAAGEAFVKGDTVARQGYYHLTNDATVNVAVSAANATNPRVDRVICRAYDSTVTGATDTPAFEVVAGTPTAGATLANLTGAAALPVSALMLAYVLVPAASTSVTNANIGFLSLPNVGFPVAGAPPFYAFGYPLDTGPPVAKARASVAQSLADATNTVVGPLDVEDGLDLAALHSTSTNPSRMTVSVPGTYRIGATVGFAANAVGNRFVGFLKNGATTLSAWRGLAAVATSPSIGSASIIARLAWGDYIEIYASQSSGGALNAVVDGLTYPALSLEWVGL